MIIKNLIEGTLRNAKALTPLPRDQWGIARGIWAGQFSQGELFPILPENLDQVDLVWIAENPGEWSSSSRPELYTTEVFHWETYMSHYRANLDIAHWRSVRKALGKIGGGRRMKILFSNAYLFEWPSMKKARENDVATFFSTYQGPLFSALRETGAIGIGTRVCLSGCYAQAAWNQLLNDQPRLTEIEAISLGHPSRGHLDQSLRKLGY